MFEGGTRILPDDPICTKAVEITKSQDFSSTAFQEVLNRYHFNKDQVYYLNELEHRSIHIVSGQLHKFSTNQIELFKKQWNYISKKKFYQQIAPAWIVHSIM